MSRPLAAVVLLGLTFVAADEHLQHEVPSPGLAFTHVNVIDVEDGSVARDRTVIVDNVRSVSSKPGTRSDAGTRLKLKRKTVRHGRPPRARRLGWHRGNTNALAFQQ